ncbi:putative glycosyltransferase, DXD sugar-binding, alpha 1,4-glycosyltransferase [Rosa chinensis]|uniref:Putative glycosyltransferase, DXD sugar-binding, alpha 1,4-glycosyltransferase n=1 Tax=Rosa chinensis TaxID=74649 RepID=A0A2P6R975_ROSCH|nr:putative glycosyltransferase, DXD sugar-binding, alpha 1,4-glycosyltransferase [Rosa chinensis]
MMSSRIDSRLLSLAKFHIFCTVSLVAIIFIIYADGIIYTDSQNSVELKDKAVSQVLQTHSIERQFIKSDITRKALRSMQENVLDVVEVDTEDTSPVVAPFNVTEEERISWFREKLPEFVIFDSDEKALQFHGRVLEFFDHKCDTQFFMTWISPARSFGSREFLSMESVFRAHPRGCLMILSRTMDSRRGYRLLKPLQDRGFKVHAVTPDLSFLFKNTPAEAWFAEMKTGNRDPGVYLDTDFIVMKSFSGLRNSIGAQSMDAVSKNWTRLNNAVLVFDMNHPLLRKFIEEFALTFDGNKWGHNGPYLVSRVVQRVQNRPGYNFTVLPRMAFYPVDWSRIGGLFKKPKNHADTKWINAKLLQLSEETYGVHLWNKQSSRVLIEEGSIMQRLISDHCVICKDIYSS